MSPDAIRKLLAEAFAPVLGAAGGVVVWRCLRPTEDAAFRAPQGSSIEG
jgi:hypothetical protein